jgi:polyphosphate glucokinase
MTNALIPTTDRGPAAAAPAPKKPCTLAIDIGGSGLKAAVLDCAGAMCCERARIETPPGLTPQALVEALATLTAPLPPYERVSVGFPGVVTNGTIVTAPNLGTERFRGFDLAGALSARLGRPVRVLNDADMQGYAAVSGKGVEMVVTLGTGFGTALFGNGRLAPHLELAHHPFRKGQTYEQQLGDAARGKVGKKKWRKRVLLAIDQLRNLVNFDRLYIGGGNAKHLDVDLPPDCLKIDNTAGILGGIKLWETTA